MITEVKLKKSNGIFYGWVVLAAVLVTLLLGYGIRNTFSVFYPAVVQEFGWERGNTAIMFSLSILVYGLVAPLAGRLIDRFSPRLVLSVGACIVGGSISLCSLATSQWHFFLLYGVLAGASLSLIGWTPASTIISNWFVKKRGLTFGILSAGFGGSLVSAYVAQFLITRFGWQSAYLIMGIFTILFLVPLCSLLIYRNPREKGLPAGGMDTEVPEPQHQDETVVQSVPDKNWSNDDLTLSKAMTTHQFWLLFMIAFCLLGLTEQIAIAHQVYFFIDIGYDPLLAATVYSVFGITFVIGNLSSFLSDRFGREKIFIPACILCIGAVSLMLIMDSASPSWMAFTFAICLGLGLGLAAPVFFTTVADLFHGKNFGSIQGTVVLGFSLGGTISPWLAGFLHDITGSYFTTFLFLIASLSASAVLMWLAAPRKLRPVSD